MQDATWLISQQYQATHSRPPVDAAVDALEPGADLVRLVSAFDAYKTSMEAHFAEEEAVCVPLMRAYFSFKEIAEVMGIPKGTVMSRLFHARRKLKEQVVGLVGEEAEHELLR